MTSPKNNILAETVPRPALGTFFLCLGLLAYELLCVRILPIVVGPHMVYGVIAMAMLGASAACTYVTVFGRPGFYKHIHCFCWCISIGCAIVFAGVTAYYQYTDTVIWGTFNDQSIMLLLRFLRKNIFYTSIVVGFLLSIPYVLFGIVIASLFRELQPSYYHRVYAADLFGAASGCIALIAALEFSGYTAAILLVFVMPLIASFAFGGMGRIKTFVSIVLVSLVALISLVPSIRELFEPFPHIRALARDYKGTKVANELWHSWNNYTRVGLLQIRQGKERAQHIYALEKGQGWARLVEYNPLQKKKQGWLEPSSMHPADALSIFKPRKSLILLAGVGADMLRLHKLCNGQCEITGVELNNDMINHALSQRSFRLEEFLSLPNIKLVASEAREYLERSKETYEAILISSTGASVLYYVGTSGHTAQYLYTKEAFDAYIDHLAPSGVLTVVNTNKAKQLLILRKIFNERGWDNLHRSVVIIKIMRSGDPMEAFSAWYSSADNNILLLKPAGFSEKDIQEIKRYVQRSGQTLIFAPDYVHPDYQIYKHVVQEEDPETVIRRAAQEFSIGLQIPTDNYPFILDMSPRNLVLQSRFWLGHSKEEIEQLWRFKKDFFIFVIDALGLAVIVILLPLLWKKRLELSSTVFQHLAFFFCIGTGFMFVEVGLVQKLGLLLGNPGFAIAIVLATLILGTGTGSITSDALFSRKILTFQKVCTMIPPLMISLLLVIDLGISYLLALSWPLKAGSVVFLLFFIGFFMGQLFPQGLKKAGQVSPTLVPWAWAINGAASTVAAGVGVILSRSLGFNAIILCGAVCYGLVLAIPRYR